MVFSSLVGCISLDVRGNAADIVLANKRLAVLPSTSPPATRLKMKYLACLDKLFLNSD
jgi:hypothetical protein